MIIRPAAVALLLAALAVPAAADEEPPEDAPAEETQTAPTVPHRAFRQRPAAGRPAIPPPADEPGDAPPPDGGGTGVQGGGNSLGGAGLGVGSSAPPSNSGGAPRATAGGGSSGAGAAAPGDFTIVDLDKLPDAYNGSGGHKRINMKGLKGLAVRFHTKQFSGRMFRFVTGTYLGGQASDVILKAAISRVPGDLTSANGCRVKTVSNDAGMTRSFSEIKMVVDAGEPAADATDRQRQAARTNLGYVNKGQACAVESDSEYFYNIAGDCDWASIEHQNSMGWDNKGPANGCPISLANNGILELGPGYVHKPYVKSDKPKYNGLTAAEEKEYQKWLASLPDNVRLVILSGSTQGRYQWWKELGGGK